MFVADDVIGFLFAWELMTLATAALVATEHETRAEPARRVPVSRHVARGHRRPGRRLLHAGLRLRLACRSRRFLAGDVVSGPLRDVLFGLFFFGFGVKAGVIPLHVWLPEAHPAAPSSISALMSAVLIKAGVYGLFRVCAFGLGTPACGWGLAFMGGRHALGDSRRALCADAERSQAPPRLQHHRERRDHPARAGRRDDDAGDGPTRAGGRGDGGQPLPRAESRGLQGTAVPRRGKRRDGDGHAADRGVGGLLRRMPWTGAVLPRRRAGDLGCCPPSTASPASGSRFRRCCSGSQFVPGLTRVNFPLAGALLALTSALAAACFVKAFGISFLALPRSRGSGGGARIAGGDARAAGFPGALCLGLGLFPGIGPDALWTRDGLAARAAAVADLVRGALGHGGRARTVRAA